MKIFYLALIFSVLLIGGCRIQDNRVHIVRVPAMESLQDVGKIKSALSSLAGVSVNRCIFDHTNRMVTVYYDSMVVAQKNIEISIAEAGYDANSIKSVK
jgi:copper chaperone CopZ